MEYKPQKELDFWFSKTFPDFCTWEGGICVLELAAGTLKTGYPHLQALSQDKEQGVHPHVAT
jgi:hypothetical protein